MKKYVFAVFGVVKKHDLPLLCGLYSSIDSAEEARLFLSEHNKNSVFYISNEVLND